MVRRKAYDLMSEGSNAVSVTSKADAFASYFVPVGTLLGQFYYVWSENSMYGELGDVVLPSNIRLIFISGLMQMQENESLIQPN